MPLIRTLDAPVLSPRPGVPWADTMLLNPAIIDDPETRRLHMLFRATGPWPRAQQPGRPPPYPIFLGYATSDDDGHTWQADWTRPCLAPALATTPDTIRIRTPDGRALVNHANGCIEDPRLFRLENKLYLTTACRMFPPGPYWEHDDPMQCAPDWARAATASNNPGGLGRAARENVTVSVLWEVDLARLAARDYDAAFTCITHLTDPERGENRDVFLFPEKLHIDGRPRYASLHRPFTPADYGAQYADKRPSIFLAIADTLEDLPTPRAEHRLLAEPCLDWEGNRIGASWPPIPLDDGEWLIPYHGKQDDTIGYTQSFMIARQNPATGWPEVTHRCSDRLMYAQKRWELEGRFKTPCVFTCAGLIRDNRLMMSYGAADTVAGIAWTDYPPLITHIRQFDAQGRQKKAS